MGKRNSIVYSVWAMLYCFHNSFISFMQVQHSMRDMDKHVFIAVQSIQFDLYFT